MEWATQLEYLSRTRTKHVADEIIKGYRVSTVWLGLDHNHLGFMEGGRPLLFETMVFAENDDSMTDQFMRRYSSWEEAEWGHQIVCNLILQGFADETKDMPGLSNNSNVG